MPDTMPATEARSWWLALIDNALGLVEDALVLMLHGSAARAGSLHVLAMEELAKANGVYDQCHEAWTAGAEVDLTVDLDAWGSKHVPKLHRSVSYSGGLGPFWGDYSEWKDFDLSQPLDLPAWYAESRERDETQARELNRRKMAGLYVDRDPTGIRSPMTLTPDGLNEQIERTADVVLMALIRDHTRMKHEAQAGAYVSTSDLQNRAMAIAHPQEFEDYVDDVGHPPGEGPQQV